eukprot:m.1375328 g.1375328  ORF g.1375328 m.1375328 type:complete len:515 (-) comp24960_c1_seq58:2555-4099(-)
MKGTAAVCLTTFLAVLACGTAEAVGAEARCQRGDEDCSSTETISTKYSESSNRPSKKRKAKQLSWPCNTIPLDVLAALQSDGSTDSYWFIKILRERAEVYGKEGLLQLLLTTRYSNHISYSSFTRAGDTEIDSGNNFNYLDEYGARRATKVTQDTLRNSAGDPPVLDLPLGHSEDFYTQTNTTINDAYLRNFDWVQHGDEFLCMRDKVRTTHVKGCTGWAKLTNSPPVAVISSGSRVGTKVLEKQLQKFPHVYNPTKPPTTITTDNKYRTWVIIGGDVPESFMFEHAMRILQSQYFGRVLVEGLNMQISAMRPGFFGVSPIGFTSAYLETIDARDFVRNMELAQIKFDKEGKTGILAAWGAVYSHLDTAIPSRVRAAEWVQTSTFARRERLPFEAYHRRLAGSRFALCPSGRGVQSPKIVEAWAAKAIPIVEAEDAFKELAKLGYPIVVVNTWHEITEAKMDTWWTQHRSALNHVWWLLLSDVWSVFVRHPCPGSISDFVTSLRAGMCPSVQHC